MAAWNAKRVGINAKMACPKSLRCTDKETRAKNMRPPIVKIIPHKRYFFLLFINYFLFNKYRDFQDLCLPYLAHHHHLYRQVHPRHFHRLHPRHLDHWHSRRRPPYPLASAMFYHAVTDFPQFARAIKMIAMAHKIMPVGSKNIIIF